MMMVTNQIVVVYLFQGWEGRREAGKWCPIGLGPSRILEEELPNCGESLGTTSFQVGFLKPAQSPGCLLFLQVSALKPSQWIFFLLRTQLIRCLMMLCVFPLVFSAGPQSSPFSLLGRGHQHSPTHPSVTFSHPWVVLLSLWAPTVQHVFTPQDWPCRIPHVLPLLSLPIQILLTAHRGYDKSIQDSQPPGSSSAFLRQPVICCQVKLPKAGVFKCFWPWLTIRSTFYLPTQYTHTKLTKQCHTSIFFYSWSTM